MIDHLPNWINILFLLTTVVTIIIFYLANGRSNKLILLFITWSIVQSVLAYIGFYQDTQSIPPRFALVLLPSTLFIIYGLLPTPRKWILENKNVQLSTFLHTIRVPMEFVLLYLFIYDMIPQLMTFEGRNFDIIAGVTALIVGMLYAKGKVSEKILLIWNVLGLILILFILINGILSAELPIQQFAFEQPNRALNYFPFILLPAIVVPLVIYSHITDIIKLRSAINKLR